MGAAHIISKPFSRLALLARTLSETITAGKA
jgi:hypothetical protein